MYEYGYINTIKHMQLYYYNAATQINNYNYICTAKLYEYNYIIINKHLNHENVDQINQK